MKIIIAAAILALSAFAATASAEDATTLLANNKCMMCHAVDQKKIGPSLKETAAKYSGDPAAAAKLVAELANGAGHPKAGAPEADIKQMIDYILGLK